MSDSFDVHLALSNMSGAIESVMGEYWSEIEVPTKAMLERRKGRLELLASMKASSQIDEEEFQARLLDEARLLEANIHVLTVRGKIVARRAATAAMKSFEAAL